MIKKIQTKNMTTEEKQSTYREAKFLELLSHPNIVHFREIYKNSKNEVCIVMDYADGGDMAKVIKEYKAQNVFMTEQRILHYFAQIALAIKHVHANKIIHRDLKSGNVFLTQNAIVKLGDFGIARQLDTTADYAQTVVGTPYFLSPEII